MNLPDGDEDVTESQPVHDVEKNKGGGEDNSWYSVLQDIKYYDII